MGDLSFNIEDNSPVNAGALVCRQFSPLPWHPLRGLRGPSRLRFSSWEVVTTRTVTNKRCTVQLLHETVRVGQL